MPQKCRVCSHKKTKQIEEAIVGGQPHTQIADRFGIHFQSVRYHAEHHLPEKLVQAVEDREQENAESILDGINDLLTRTKNILDQAEDNDQKRLALDAIKEARSTYELLSKIAVKLEEYRRKDEEKRGQHLNNETADGLKALSDAELKTLIQLAGKVHAAKPEYELDQTSRYIIEAMNTVKPTEASQNQSDLAQNGGGEDKNSQKNGSSSYDSDFDDWGDDLDFDLELDNEIPSEETDPDWLVRDRKQH